jgi:hypothetical protein
MAAPRPAAPSAVEAAARRERGDEALRDEALRTEFSFVLPRGYVDEEGQVHRTGTMRLATARDEIRPLLSRVVTRLGSVDPITPAVIEGMFASDLAFLQDLYRRINQEGHTQAAVSCPECDHEFVVDVAGDVEGRS